jgi:hypothetical protein
MNIQELQRKIREEKIQGGEDLRIEDVLQLLNGAVTRIGYTLHFEKVDVEARGTVIYIQGNN